MAKIQQKGPALRQLRQRHGYPKVTAFAEVIDHDAGDLSRIERAQGRVTLNIIEKYAAALGLRPSEVLAYLEGGHEPVAGTTLSKDLTSLEKSIDIVENTLEKEGIRPPTKDKAALITAVFEIIADGGAVSESFLRNLLRAVRHMK